MKQKTFIASGLLFLSFPFITSSLTIVSPGQILKTWMFYIAFISLLLFILSLFLFLVFKREGYNFKKIKFFVILFFIFFIITTGGIVFIPEALSENIMIFLFPEDYENFWEGVAKRHVHEFGGLSKKWSCGDYLIDERDWQTYSTVKIESQCWMAENLRYTGSGCLDNPWKDYNQLAPWNACRLSGGNEWDRDEVIYQWGVAMNGFIDEKSQGLCPNGWHVPTDSEWHLLENNLASESCNSSRIGWECGLAGTAMMAEPGGNNSSGFNALPTGFRDSSGSLLLTDFDLGWWSSSIYAKEESLNTSKEFSEMSGNHPWIRYLYFNINFNVPTIYRGFYHESYGYPMRCVKD